MKRRDTRSMAEIATGIAIAVAVVASLYFYMTGAGGTEPSEALPVAIALILVAFAVYIFWDRAKNMQRGLPAKDERLANMSYRAGHCGFIAAILTAVGAPLLSELLYGHELQGSHITAAVVIVSGFAFAMSYLYLARKGV